MSIISLLLLFNIVYSLVLQNIYNYYIIQKYMSHCVFNVFCLMIVFIFVYNVFWLIYVEYYHIRLLYFGTLADLFICLICLCKYINPFLPNGHPMAVFVRFFPTKSLISLLILDIFDWTVLPVCTHGHSHQKMFFSTPLSFLPFVSDFEKSEIA